MGIVTDHRRTKTLPLAAVFFAVAIGLWYFLSGNSEISDLFSEHYPIRKQVGITLPLSNQTGRDLKSAEVRLLWCCRTDLGPGDGSRHHRFSVSAVQ